ncbi:hypothetical protein COU91_01235 [Candidatus Saccharibacteria bacterium CG10_big_fil_rev_8_21_14_0_10_47_8]|nr:MAG: hypothetical protein COU91_01235 [Candidatus Saccharibacteria bacterium CG10_big_fil_rev_8_21_14_0_10_47_8]
MFLQHKSVKNKEPKIKYEDYLSLESEPKYSKTHKVNQYLDEELLANRFFLKRRVWKNMDKIRRTNARLNTPHQSHDKRVFKPRHLHMPV